MTNELTRRIGCDIRAARKRRNLTIRKLGELADVPYNSIYLIEANKRCVTLPLLQRIANALNLDVCVELKEREETNASSQRY